MFRWFKLHFIPSEENAYQPHFLRLKIALGILLLVALLEGTYLFTTSILLPRSAQFAAIFASVLIDETNKVRQTDRLDTLQINAKLEEAARLKAEDMASKGYFAHNTPDGKTPWYWFEKVGYDYAAAGENLAVNFTDSKDVTEAWMRSPSHRANIMNGNYSEIGIATAAGTYKGKPAIFVVQEFGRPSIIARQIEDASSTVSALTALITESASPILKEVQPPRATAPTPSKVKPPALTAAPPVVQASPAATQTVATTPATPAVVVAGAETEKLFTDTADVSSAVARIPALPSRFDTLIASPRTITTTVYLILGAILSLALGLAVFIKIRIQYPHIIANGVLLIAIVCSLLLLNAVLMTTKGVI